MKWNVIALALSTLVSPLVFADTTLDFWTKAWSKGKPFEINGSNKIQVQNGSFREEQQIQHTDKGYVSSNRSESSWQVVNLKERFYQRFNPEGRTAFQYRLGHPTTRYVPLWEKISELNPNRLVIEKVVVSSTSFRSTQQFGGLNEISCEQFVFRAWLKYTVKDAGVRPAELDLNVCATPLTARFKQARDEEAAIYKKLSGAQPLPLLSQAPFVTNKMGGFLPAGTDKAIVTMLNNLANEWKRADVYPTQVKLSFRWTDVADDSNTPDLTASTDLLTILSTPLPAVIWAIRPDFTLEKVGDSADLSDLTNDSNADFWKKQTTFFKTNDTEAKRKELYQIAGIRDPKACEFLKTIGADRSQPDEIRGTAVDYLHYCQRNVDGDSNDLSALRTFLKDSSSRVRLSAAQSLAQQGDESARPVLLDVLRTTPLGDFQIEQAAYRALSGLSEIGKEEDLPALDAFRKKGVPKSFLERANETEREIRYRGLTDGRSRLRFLQEKSEGRSDASTRSWALERLIRLAGEPGFAYQTDARNYLEKLVQDKTYPLPSTVKDTLLFRCRLDKNFCLLEPSK